MNKVVVVDASVAIKWVLLEDGSDVAARLLGQWDRERIKPIAPALFVYEVTNILYRQVVVKKLIYEEASNRGLNSA